MRAHQRLKETAKIKVTDSTKLRIIWGYGDVGIYTTVKAVRHGLFCIQSNSQEIIEILQEMIDTGVKGLVKTVEGRSFHQIQVDILG